MKVAIFIVVSALLGLFTCHEMPKVVHHNRHHYQKQHLNFRSEPSAMIDGLEAFHNSSTHLIGFANKTQTAAVIFDYTSALLVLFNGQNGQAVVVDETMLKLINESVWVGSAQNFEIFFQNLRSLNTISEKTGQTSSLTQPDDATLNEIKIISEQLGVDSRSVVETLRRISKDLNRFSEIIKEIMTDNNCRLPISPGISRFPGVLRGIFTLFRNAGGGFVPALHQQNWKPVFVSPTGIETLIRILRLFSTHLDFSQNFGRFLNNANNLFHVVAQFGQGNQPNGIDNAFRIIDQVFQARNGQISMDTLIRELLRIGENRALQFSNFTLTSILQEFRQITAIQNLSFHNGQQLQEFNNVIQGLEGGNLNVGGLHVCRIFQLFTSGQITNATDLGVRVLLQLNHQFNPVIVIPRFFAHLALGFLNSTTGPGLIPGLNPNQTTSILPQAIDQLLRNRTALFNIVQNPNFSNIISSISTALNQSSNGALNFGNLFQNFGNAINANPILDGINSVLSGAINPLQQNSAPGTASSLSDVTSQSEPASLDPLEQNFTQATPPNLGNLISALQSGLNFSTEATTLEPSTVSEISERKYHGGKNVRGKLGEKHGRSKESRSHHFHSRSHKKEHHLKEKNH